MVDCPLEIEPYMRDQREPHPYVWEPTGCAEDLSAPELHRLRVKTECSYLMYDVRRKK